jgi:hypothetical protein
MDGDRAVKDNGLHTINRLLSVGTSPGAIDDGSSLVKQSALGLKKSVERLLQTQTKGATVLTKSLRNRMVPIPCLEHGYVTEGKARRNDGLQVQPSFERTQMSWNLKKGRNWIPASDGSHRKAVLWDQRFDEFSSDSTLFYDQLRDKRPDWHSSESIIQARGHVYEAFSSYGNLGTKSAQDQRLETLPQHLIEQASDFDDNGYTPSFHAVNRNDLETVINLADLGDVDFNAPCAVSGADWYAPAFYAAVGNKCKIMRVLKTVGVDLQKPCCRKGGTPAYYAVKNGNCSMLRLLADAGVDLGAECISTDNVHQHIRDNARVRRLQDPHNVQEQADARAEAHMRGERILPELAPTSPTKQSGHTFAQELDMEENGYGEVSEVSDPALIYKSALNAGADAALNALIKGVRPDVASRAAGDASAARMMGMRQSYRVVAQAAYNAVIAAEGSPEDGRIVAARHAAKVSFDDAVRRTELQRKEEERSKGSGSNLGEEMLLNDTEGNRIPNADAYEIAHMGVSGRAEYEAAQYKKRLKLEKRKQILERRAEERQADVTEWTKSAAEGAADVVYMLKGDMKEASLASGRAAESASYEKKVHISLRGHETGRLARQSYAQNELEFGLTPYGVAVDMGAAKGVEVVRTLHALGIDIRLPCTRKNKFTPVKVAIRKAEQRRLRRLKLFEQREAAKEREKELAASRPGYRPGTSAGITSRNGGKDNGEVRIDYYKGQEPMVELLAEILGGGDAVKWLRMRQEENGARQKKLWKEKQEDLTRLIMRGGTIGAKAREAMEGNSAKRRVARRNVRTKVFPAGKWYRVIREGGIAVRETMELSSILIRKMEHGEVFMATEKALVANDNVRLRTKDGWTSATSTYDNSKVVERCQNPRAASQR